MKRAAIRLTLLAAAVTLSVAAWSGPSPDEAIPATISPCLIVNQGLLSDTAFFIVRGETIAPCPEQEVLIIHRAGERLLGSETAAAANLHRFMSHLPEQVRVAFYSPSWPEATFRSGSALAESDVAAFLRSGAWSEGDEGPRLSRLIALWPNIDRSLPRSIIFLGGSRSRQRFQLTPELLAACLEKRIIVQDFAFASAAPTGSGWECFCAATGGDAWPASAVATPAPWIADEIATDTTASLAATPARALVHALSIALPIHSLAPQVRFESGRPLSRLVARPWTGNRPIMAYASTVQDQGSLPDRCQPTLTVTEDSTALSLPSAVSRSLPDDEMRSRYEDEFRRQLRLKQQAFGLTDLERRWLEREAGGSPAPASTLRSLARNRPLQLWFEIFTGRLAIDESLQLDRVLAPAAPGEEVVLVSALEPPALAHLDYDSMVGKRRVEDLPLARFCPADMAILSFRSIDDAFALGDFCDYWSADFGRIYFSEMSTSLFKRKLLDRLAIRLDESLRPFYSLAVGEFGFFISEPALGVTQDVALVMAPRQAKLVRERLMGYRQEFRQSHADAREETFSIGDDPVQALFTPDRSLSSYAVFRDDLVILATSRVSLERILATVNGRAPALAREADIRLLAANLAASGGVLALGEKFIARAISPEWRIKFARRARCLRNLEALDEEAAFAARSWPPVPPRAATRCPEGGAYRLVNGRWTCSMHGSADFATPLGEWTVAKATGAEANAYQAFAASYQRYWARAMDPIGIGCRNRDDGMIEFHTLILPLIEQSEYRLLKRILGHGEVRPLRSWAGFPSSTVLLGVFFNPAAAWLRGEPSEFGREIGIESRKQEQEDRLRRELDWPRRQPLFGWLGDEWGVALLDAGAEEFAATTRLGRRGGANLPMAIFVSVKDEARAARFLEHLSRSNVDCGRLTRVDSSRGHRYRWKLWPGMEPLVGVVDGKLVATLAPALLEPAGGERLGRGVLAELGESLENAGQALFLLHLDSAPLLRRALYQGLFALEAEACRAARRGDGESRVTECPYGGHWFGGYGDLRFCTRHDRVPPDFMAWPEADTAFPLRRKLEKLERLGLSFRITEDGLEARLAIDNPVAPPPSVLQRLTSSRWLVLAGVAVLTLAGGTAIFVLLVRRRGWADAHHE